MARFSALAGLVPVRSTAACGVDPDDRKRSAFAWGDVAQRTLSPLPGNPPEVTRASRAAILADLSGRTAAAGSARRNSRSRPGRDQRTGERCRSLGEQFGAASSGKAGEPMNRLIGPMPQSSADAEQRPPVDAARRRRCRDQQSEQVGVDAERLADQQAAGNTERDRMRRLQADAQRDAGVGANANSGVDAEGDPDVGGRVQAGAAARTHAPYDRASARTERQHHAGERRVDAASFSSAVHISSPIQHVGG